MENARWRQKERSSPAVFTARAVSVAAALATAGGCSSRGDGFDGYRSPAVVHKLQLPATEAAAVLSGGGRLIAHYGGSTLIEVDEAQLGELPAGTPALLGDYQNRVLLNVGAIDTASSSGKALRQAAVAAAAGRRLHLVQFRGPVLPQWYADLGATGARVVTYIPENAYLVYGDDSTLTRVRTLAQAPAVQWDAPYLDSYKLDPSVAAAKADAYAIQLVEDPVANAPTEAIILSRSRSLSQRPPARDVSLGYVNLIAFVGAADLNAIAAQPDVVSIQPYVVPTMLCERQDQILAGNLTLDQPSGPGYLSWLASKGFAAAQFGGGSAFGVDLTDSGIDNGTQAPNHFGLYPGGDIASPSRIVYNRLVGTPNSGSTLQGCDGHGNINAHIIGGFNDLSAAPHADAQGFRPGLGVAPWVKIGSSVIFDSSQFTTPDFEDLQSRAYSDGMRISSNSWGATTGNTYNADAQRYDALVRDAQPSSAIVPLAGNQEMVIVFAAGNAGPASNTVSPPGTAKNVLTVGASENVYPFAGADGCTTGDDQANSAFDIVGFSSRGPTSDGRRKPDIMAPGTHVGGGVAQAPGQRATPPAVAAGQANACFDGTGVCGGIAGSDFYPSGQQWYTASSGTSHSTPAVSGAAALLRQYFINRGLAAPSPAMTKAYLMNAARFMTGAGISTGERLYSNNQGMGLLDLGAALDGTPRILRDELGDDTFTASGQTRTFNAFVSDLSRPVRVTLAWTDAPGATTGAAWKNDLNLVVTRGGTTFLGNAFAGATSVTGGAPDTQNNVESAFLAPDTAGSVTVTVTAANINSDGVPGTGGALDQDFALVIGNACATAPPAAPTGVTAAPDGDNRITVGWTPGGAPTYRVYRAATAGGPYTLIGARPTPPFVDTTVSGGATYFYVVRAADCAESAASAEVPATATGRCTGAPAFTGLASASNGAGPACTVNLVWPPAVPACGGTLTYNIYRSTTAGFTPSRATRIASGVTGTGYADAANIDSAQTYEYIIRATEQSAEGAQEETNAVRKAARLGGLHFADDFDLGRPANAPAYWIESGVQGGADLLSIVSGCHYQSPTNAYKFGAAGCGGTYTASKIDRLILGGNGSTSDAINGFLLPANATNGLLTFRQWFTMETSFDGVDLRYSVTGPTGTFIKIADAPSAGAPFIVTGGYTGTISSIGAAWTGTQNGSNGALRQVTVDVNALANQRVWFAWEFHSDSTINQEGHYLDDVTLNVDGGMACATQPALPGPAVLYRITGLSAAQVGVPTTFTITAIDPYGQTAAGYTGTANLTSSDAGATLAARATFTAGVAANVPVTFSTLGTQTVTASDVADPSIAGNGSATVSAGPAAQLAFTVQPAGAVAGASVAPAIQVSLKDASGNLATGSTASVTLAIVANPAGGTLGGTLTRAAVAGVATFGDITLDQAGAGYTLSAAAPGLAMATSTPFTVTAGSPAALTFIAQPSDVDSGGFFAPAVSVAVVDKFGNRATTAAVSIVLALASNPGGGTLAGALTAPALSGLATFPDLSINRAAAGYTLRATASGLTSATSTLFAVRPGAPSRLRFTAQPASAAAGTALAPAVTVTVFDAAANVATTTAVTVSLSLIVNPGAAALRGTVSRAAADGVATFDNLSLDHVGSGYKLQAFAGEGIPAVTSAGFDISAGPPGALAFVVQPAGAVAGETMAPAPAVKVTDAFGNDVGAAPATITLALGPGGPALLGATTVAAAGGVATFGDLSIRQAGTGYNLTASSPGLAPATSAPFGVAPAAPAALAFDVQPTPTRAGQTIAPAVAVKVKDDFGNDVPGAPNSVSLTLDNAPNAALSGTTTVKASAGVATFSGLSVDRPGTGYTMVASSAALAAATSAPFAVTPAELALLEFTVQPGATVAGAAIAPAVQVTQKDDRGHRLLGSSAAVSIALASRPPDGTIAGTTTAAAVDGVATFANLSVNRSAAGYRLSATSGNVTASSALFDVTPAAAATYVFSGLPARVITGVETTFSAAATDAFGNTVAGYAGAATMTSSDPQAALPDRVVFSGGIASGITLLLRTPGAQTVTLTDEAATTPTGTGTVTVADVASPTVRVTSPLDGATVSGAVTVRALGTVGAGTTISHIDVLVDGTIIGSGAGSPLSVTWDTGAFQPGSTHTIQATIQDTLDHTAASAPVRVAIALGDGGGYDGDAAGDHPDAADGGNDGSIDGTSGTPDGLPDAATSDAGVALNDAPSDSSRGDVADRDRDDAISDAEASDADGSNDHAGNGGNGGTGGCSCSSAGAGDIGASGVIGTLLILTVACRDRRARRRDKRRSR